METFSVPKGSILETPGRSACSTSSITRTTRLRKTSGLVLVDLETGGSPWSPLAREAVKQFRRARVLPSLAGASFRKARPELRPPVTTIRTIFHSFSGRRAFCGSRRDKLQALRPLATQGQTLHY